MNVEQKDSQARPFGYGRALRVLAATAAAVTLVRLMYTCQPLMNFVWLNAAVACHAFNRPHLFHTFGVAAMVFVGALGWVAVWVLCGLLALTPARVKNLRHR
ncbi:MAG: hypothetical protein PHT12_02455 [Patescibacteria group bacterium]|nr:hypothetical protein [Patescibacteria group bacterium]